MGPRKCTRICRVRGVRGWEAPRRGPTSLQHRSRQRGHVSLELWNHVLDESTGVRKRTRFWNGFLVRFPAYFVAICLFGCGGQLDKNAANAGSDGGARDGFVDASASDISVIDAQPTTCSRADCTPYKPPPGPQVTCGGVACVCDSPAMLTGCSFRVGLAGPDRIVWCCP